MGGTRLEFGKGWKGELLTQKRYEKSFGLCSWRSFLLWSVLCWADWWMNYQQACKPKFRLRPERAHFPYVLPPDQPGGPQSRQPRQQRIINRKWALSTYIRVYQLKPNYKGKIVTLTKKMLVTFSDDYCTVISSWSNHSVKWEPGWVGWPSCKKSLQSEDPFLAALGPGI